jgi:probable F420-dependent oxidoreductase
VDFGFSLPGRGPLARPAFVVKIAARAEALGYSSVFVTDHVVLPVSATRSSYPYSVSGQFPGGGRQDYLEPLAMLGYLACATTRIRLGTSVLVIPYRNPLVTAKTLATLDLLSKGRLILGAGVGWLREEFEALRTAPFDERGRVTDEYLRIMRLAWTTDPVSFAGRHYAVADVHALPKPAQSGGIPIWIGGHTDAAVRRTGALGDGWHPVGLRPPALLHPDEYAEKVKGIHAAARGAGRDPASITLTLRVPMELRPRGKATGGERPMFQGTAEQVAVDIRRYADLGVTHFVFDPTTQDLPSVLANMTRFAAEVRPRFTRPRPAATRAPRRASPPSKPTSRRRP